MGLMAKPSPGDVDRNPSYPAVAGPADAEFGPKRPYTAPGEIEADERIAQPLEIIGGPSGTRTLDHRVKSPVLYQLS